MSPTTDRTAHLPEELGMYVDTVRKEHPAIDQVWLLGRPTERDGGPQGVWSLLAFGDADALAALRRDTDLHRADVELLVVTDGERFEAGWGERPPGTLTGIGWRLDDPHSAAFGPAGTDDERVIATRVR